MSRNTFSIRGVLLGLSLGVNAGLAFVLIGSALRAERMEPPPATVGEPEHPPEYYETFELLYIVEDRQGDACPLKFATPFGFFFGPAGQEHDMLQLVYEQTSERSADAYEAGPVFIRRGDIVLDAGAHLGVFTRIALNHGAGKVVAFEPQPACIPCFRKTFAKEIASGKVVLVEKAVWEATGKLHFRDDGLDFRADEANAGPDGEARSAGVEVAATTIDETVRELGLPRVDFIKMDIEGSERYALRGAKDTLARFAPMMAMSGYHKPDDREVLPKVALQYQPNYQVVIGELPRPLPGEPRWGGLIYFFKKEP